jgi:hypothetical protein
MYFVVSGENHGDVLPGVQSLRKAMQEKHNAFPSRIGNNHSSELHIGIDVYEADFRFRVLVTRKWETPS